MDVTFTAPDGGARTLRRAGVGRPLLAVPGSGGGLDSWAPVAAHLAGFQTWTLARRGYDPSDAPRGSVTFAAEAADVVAALEVVAERTGTDAVPLLGGSVGAVVALHVALHVALTGAARLGPVVLFEPPLFATGAAVTDVARRHHDLVAAGDLPGATALFAAGVARVPAEILAAFPAVPDPDPVEALRVARGSDLDVAALAAEPTGDDDDLTRFAGIAAPVLLLQGQHTWSPMPETMDRLAAVLHPARVVLEGQSHFASHTAPDAFAAAVEGFLRGRT